MLTGLFDKINISRPELIFSNHNDVLDVVTLRQCGYGEIKARDPIGTAMLPGSIRAAELSKRLELSLEKNAKLRKDIYVQRKETKELRKELRKDREAHAQQIATLVKALTPSTSHH